MPWDEVGLVAFVFSPKQTVVLFVCTTGTIFTPGLYLFQGIGRYIHIWMILTEQGRRARRVKAIHIPRIDIIQFTRSNSHVLEHSAWNMGHQFCDSRDQWIIEIRSFPKLTPDRIITRRWSSAHACLHSLRRWTSKTANSILRCSPQRWPKNSKVIIWTWCGEDE